MDWKIVLIGVAILVVISLIIGIALAIAAKYLTVKEDDRIVEVTNRLPGYNCGACGYTGCAGFAAALVNGETNKVSQCRIAKPDKRDEIVDYLASTPGPDGKTIKVEQ